MVKAYKGDMAKEKNNRMTLVHGGSSNNNNLDSIFREICFPPHERHLCGSRYVKNSGEGSFPRALCITTNGSRSSRQMATPTPARYTHTPLLLRAHLFAHAQSESIYL